MYFLILMVRYFLLVTVPKNRACEFVWAFRYARIFPL